MELLILFIAGAKFYLLTPMYSLLLAVGSIKLEKVVSKFKSNSVKHYFIRYALPVIYVIFSLPILAMSMPLLSVESFIHLTKYMGLTAGVTHSYTRIHQLPQHFADRFGWEEMVQGISKVYDNIPPDKKENVGIMTQNWGEASAVNFYRHNYSLPEATCVEGWYYYETLRKKDFKGIYISFGLSESELFDIFNSVEQKGFFKHDYCIPHENNTPVYLCSSPKYDLNKYWIIIRNIDDNFLHLVYNEQIDSAISYYYQQKKIDPNVLLFTERQINTLGYEFLGNGKIEDAIKIFEFNVEVYPSSSYVYDSLGEAHMVKGNYKLAIINYKKSFELNPNNTNAKEMLQKLKKL